MLIALTQVVKHVLEDGKVNMHATRVVLQVFEFLRSLRLDTILGSRGSKKGSRSEPSVAEQPNQWAKVTLALPACIPSLSLTVIQRCVHKNTLALIFHHGTSLP